jgi:hypothetical protein
MKDRMHPNPSAGSTNLHNLRSFRWRVQLGLLPPATTATAATDNPTGTDSNNNNTQWPAVLAQQREDYQRLVEQHPFPGDDGEPHEGTVTDGTDVPTASAASQFDPLTAMLMEEQQKSERLQELDLKYRREKALRKRGQGNGSSRIMEDEAYDEAAAALQIIDNDLIRLPSPRTQRHVAAPESSPSSSSPSRNPHHYRGDNHPTSDSDDPTMVDVVLDNDDTTNDDDNYVSQRRAVLRQVLFVYTCQHPDPGYRQGMHEIASYLLHALQLDQEELLSALSATASDLTATMEDLAADTYTMLVHILTAILPAYDVGPSPQSQCSPLPASSRRVLSILQPHSAVLHDTLTELDTPPQLYLTKWMRLLYSREVTHVLELWDALFFPSVAVVATVATANSNTTTANANQYQYKYHHHHHQPHSWMEVLEYTAAARLLLWRHEILQAPDASSRLHLLMNLPCQADIYPLVQLTQQLLEYSYPPHGHGHVRTVVVLPEMTDTGTATITTTTSSSTGPHPLQPEHSITPTDQGHQYEFASQHEGDLGAAASALANRFSLSAVKQSLEQAKTQTESIKKRLYQEWGSLAVATNNSDHQSNHGTQQQQNDNYSSNNTYNTSSSAQKTNVTGDPLRRNYDDPLMGGIDWSGGQNRQLSSSGAAASSAAAALHPHLNGERRPLHASNESPSLVPPPSPRVQHQSQAWAQSIQASSIVLQDFVMAMEKQSAEHVGNSNAKVVPAAVWEALADLEVLRRDMLSNSGSSSGPAP